MTGRSIARRIRSGTFVGPGIWRNGRPLTLSPRYLSAGDRIRGPAPRLPLGSRESAVEDAARGGGCHMQPPVPEMTECQNWPAVAHLTADRMPARTPLSDRS